MTTTTKKRLNRLTLTISDELKAALVRNLWRGKEPPEAGLAHVMARVAAQRAALAAMPVDALIVADRLPE